MLESPNNIGFLISQVRLGLLLHRLLAALVIHMRYACCKASSSACSFLFPTMDSLSFVTASAKRKPTPPLIHVTTACGPRRQEKENLCGVKCHNTTFDPGNMAFISAEGQKQHKILFVNRCSAREECGMHLGTKEHTMRSST
jgi:hypothetical protein